MYQIMATDKRTTEDDNIVDTGNSRYIHWNGGGYIEAVDITKNVASSKENGNLYF